MIRHWGHAHTLAAGFVGGLLVDRHVMYVFFLGLLLGGLVVYSSRTLRAIGRAAAGRAAELHSATVEGIHARAQEARAKADNRVRRAAEQEAEVKKAYISGAIDGGK